MSENEAVQAEDTTADTSVEEPVEQQQDDPAEPLKKALHSERQTVKELKQQLAALSKQQEEQRLASMSEQERAIEEAKAAGRAEAMAQVQRDLTRAQVTAAAAAAGFADPADASGFLPLDDLADEQAVKDAVAQLAQTKPYLLKKAAPASIPQGPQGGQISKSDPNEWIRGMFR